MSDEPDLSEPHVVHSDKPGDRVLHMRTHRSRLAMIERDMATPLHEGYNYYLQRVDELSVEEIRDLKDLTQGLLSTAAG
ncbi:MAG: hypothetical protein J4N95_04015 [Chloroflexi bacterium]|nr:hypothetical protein [Chloroflexota bacterium]MCI0855429.1 hypothetical protein [Chloroflexota bacterium]